MTKKNKALTRADVVRSRKQQNKGSRKRSNREESYVSARVMPPVLMRGVDGSVLINDRRKLRRRLDIPLNSRGVEVQLPAVPILHIGWRLLSGLLTIGLISLLFFFFQSRLFRVQSIKLQGADRLTMENIDAVIGVMNKSVFTLEPESLENELRTNIKDLRNVSVRVGLPASLVVSVEERTPVLEWQQDDRIYWIDKDGMRFSPRGGAMELPHVDARGSPPLFIRDTENGQEDVFERPFLSKEIINAVYDIRGKIPENESIIYDPAYGLGWFDKQGWNVYLGMDMSNFDSKLNVYDGIVSYLNAKGQTPYLIDIEYIHSPFIRLEP